MAGSVLEFWFEFASTYSYPAAWRVESLARDAGVAVVWRPFLLGPIFAAQGWSDSPFNLFEAKGRYMWRDLERECAILGIPFRRPTRFPRNGLLAARVALVASGAPWGPSFVREIYRANFVDDSEISDPAVVAAVLRGLGQAPDEILERAASPANKEELRRQNRRAVDLGVFGAPSFVARGELFWGNDRLERAIAWCTGGDAAPDS